MADPTTPNRGLAVPLRGTDVGTWDTPLNNNFGAIDTIVGGIATLSLSNSNVSLNSAQAACGTIRLTGTLTANVTVTFPSVQGWWSIDNQTTGNFYVLLTCGGGNNIATQQGVVTDIQLDGSNVAFRNLGKLGEYWDYAGATVPNWVTACTVPPYLNCDGSTFSAITYPYLNTLLGGNTLPDLKGKIRATLNQGSGNITTGGSGIDGDTRFSTGGTQNVALSQANLPNLNFAVNIPSGQGAHNHTVFAAISQAGVAGSGDPGISINTTLTTSTSTLPAMSGTAASGGSGTAVNKMPPTTISGITMIRAA